MSRFHLQSLRYGYPGEIVDKTEQRLVASKAVAWDVGLASQEADLALAFECGNGSRRDLRIGDVVRAHAAIDAFELRRHDGRDDVCHVLRMNEISQSIIR